LFHEWFACRLRLGISKPPDVCTDLVAISGSALKKGSKAERAAAVVITEFFTSKVAFNARQ
jgi:hypothetical protein